MALGENVESKVTLSPFRNPNHKYAPTSIKCGALYPHKASMLAEAHQRGFDDVLVLDEDGKVAELSLKNVFLVRDGVVSTPSPNTSFLNGITRQRVIKLLREDGIEVKETELLVSDFLEADEMFSTGNVFKVTAVNKFEDLNLPGWNGRITKRARELYWKWARATA